MKKIYVYEMFIFLIFIEITANQAFAATNDYIWVTNGSSNTVTRIRKSDLTKTTINVGGFPDGVAVDDNNVWVANGNSDTVTRIDKSNLNTENYNVGNGPGGISVDDEYVWITNYLDNNLTRIRKTDLFTDYVDIGCLYPSDVVVDNNYVWVACFNGSGKCSRINKSNLSYFIIDTPFAQGLAVDENYVYVSDALGTEIVRITKSNLAKNSIPVGNYPYAINVDHNCVWVTNFDDNTVTRIDKSNWSTETINVGDRPIGISADTDYVWVANLGSNNVTRITKSNLSTTNLSVGIGPRGFGDMVGNSYDYFFSSLIVITRLSENNLLFPPTLTIAGKYYTNGQAVTNTWIGADDSIGSLCTSMFVETDSQGNFSKTWDISNNKSGTYQILLYDNEVKKQISIPLIGTSYADKFYQANDIVFEVGALYFPGIYYNPITLSCSTVSSDCEIVGPTLGRLKEDLKSFGDFMVDWTANFFSDVASNPAHIVAGVVWLHVSFQQELPKLPSVLHQLPF